MIAGMESYFHRSLDPEVTNQGQLQSEPHHLQSVVVGGGSRIISSGCKFQSEVGYVRRTDYTQSTLTAYRIFQKRIINQHSIGIDCDLLGNGIWAHRLWCECTVSHQFQNTSCFMLRLRQSVCLLTDSFDPTNTEGAELPAGNCLSQ